MLRSLIWLCHWRYERRKCGRTNYIYQVKHTRSLFLRWLAHIQCVKSKWKLHYSQEQLLSATCGSKYSSSRVNSIPSLETVILPDIMSIVISLFLLSVYVWMISNHHRLFKRSEIAVFINALLMKKEVWYVWYAYLFLCQLFWSDFKIHFFIWRGYSIDVALLSANKDLIRDIPRITRKYTSCYSYVLYFRQFWNDIERDLLR